MNWYKKAQNESYPTGIEEIATKYEIMPRDDNVFYRGGGEGNWITPYYDVARQYGKVKIYMLTRDPYLLQVNSDRAEELADNLDADPADLYYQPTPELIAELKKRGYDGFINGDNIFISNGDILKRRK